MADKEEGGAGQGGDGAGLAGGQAGAGRGHEGQCQHGEDLLDDPGQHRRSQLQPGRHRQVRQ